MMICFHVVLDCESQEEAECIALLAGLGKVHIELPTDAILISEILPKLRQYAEDLRKHLTRLISPFPEDLRPALERAVREAL